MTRTRYLQYIDAQNYKEYNIIELAQNQSKQNSKFVSSDLNTFVLAFKENREHSWHMALDA